MPLVRADIPHGHSAETKQLLRQAIKEAINRAVDPKMTKYIYVAIREVKAETGDGAPSVTVDLRPGREMACEAALAGFIGDAFAKTLGGDSGDVYLLFRETPASDHYCGGQPLPDWKPGSA